MKNVKHALFGLVLTLFANFAMADSVIAKLADDARMGQFKVNLATDKLVSADGRQFKTIGISNAMYYNDLTKEQRGAMSRETFHRLNSVVNNFDEWMSFDNLTQIVGKVRVPDIVPVESAPQASVSRSMSAPQAPVQAAAPVQPTGPGVEKSVAELQEKVEQLQKRGFNTSLLEAQILKVVAEKSKITAERQAEQYQKLAAELTVIVKFVDAAEGRFLAIEKAQDEIAGIIANPETGLAAAHVKTDKNASDITALNGQVAAVKGNGQKVEALEGQVYKLGLAVAALAIAMLAGWFVFGRNGRKTHAIAVAADAKATEAIEEVSVVQGQIGKLDIQIPDDLELQLQALNEGDVYQAVVQVEGVKYTLGFERTLDGVQISGIDQQQPTSEVKFKNLRKTINRAAGERRIRGLAPVQLVA